MATAYDASLIDRITPRIKQWETTTGRKIHPAVLDSLIREQLRMESERASKERAYDIQERQLSNQEKAAKDAASAAKVKGITDIATTAGMGYLTYKSLVKPSPMSELIAYQKTLGAQTSLAGGVPSTGAQAVHTGVPMANAPAYSPAVTSAEAGAAAVPGAGSALLNAAPQIGGLAMAQYYSGQFMQPYLDEAGFSTAGKGWTYAGLPGASIGATIDLGKKGIEAIKDIGSDIGDIFGW